LVKIKNEEKTIELIPSEFQDPRSQLPIAAFPMCLRDFRLHPGGISALPFDVSSPSRRSEPATEPGLAARTGEWRERARRWRGEQDCFQQRPEKDEAGRKDTTAVSNWEGGKERERERESQNIY